MIGWADSTLYAQIRLPDREFEKFLTENFPQIVSIKGELDTNAAKHIVGRIDARYLGIKSVEGLQYFHSVSEVNLNGNTITQLPLLDSLAELQVLSLDSNQLERLPYLGSLSKLANLSCAFNKLELLPDLHKLKNLSRLSCNNNLLTELPALEEVIKLQRLQVSNNRLVALPKGGSVSLKRLYGNNNQISQVDLVSFPNLEDIYLTNNKLKVFPDLNGLANISALDLSFNALDSIPSSSVLPPIFSFSIANNKLSFRDLYTLKPFLGKFVNSPIIFPQKMVGGNDSTVVFKEGRTFVYALDMETTPTDVVKWYKSGTLIPNVKGDVLEIKSLSRANEGEYYCSISNPDFVALVAKSPFRKLKVAECMDISQMKVQLTPAQCRYPTNAYVDEKTITIGEGPFVYRLKNIVSGADYLFTSPTLKIEKEGTYDLTVKDVFGCERLWKEYLQTSRPQSCDAIFYPDLNVPEATYYIEQKGTAKIYNSTGIKVRELVVPAYWEGRDQSGNILDSGLYLIVVNDQVSIQVSLMRAN